MSPDKKSKRQERREKIHQQERRRRLLTIGIITVVGAGTSVLLEWRGSRGVKWSQLIIVTRETGTLIVPIHEAQAFEEGDRLRLTVSEAAGITLGTVWASLSIF